MPGKPPEFEPQTLWQSQPTENDPMTVAAIHEKARLFQTRIRRRNLREYIACVAAIALFIPALFTRGSWMMQAGGGVTIAAIVFVAWQLHRRGSAAPLPVSGEALIDFHRRELIRQRDAARSVAIWYLGPFVPGMALMILGRWFQAHAPHRSVGADHLVIVLSCVIMALILLVVWLFNQWGAERLQKRIDELG